MFDHEKILLIETMPACDTILVIWFKLLALAGKQNNNGEFMLTERVPYDAEMLAGIVKRELNTVKLALQTFEHFGMIEVVDDVISIANWAKYQNVERLEELKGITEAEDSEERKREQNRIRQQRYRKNKRDRILAEIPEHRVCAYCGKAEAQTLDHIIPQSKGGTDDPQNLVACCIPCNSSKQDRDLVDFLNNSLYLHSAGLDIQSILNNPKLNKYVIHDGEKFIPLRKQDVTQNVTRVTQDSVTCNAKSNAFAEKEKRSKKEKDSELETDSQNNTNTSLVTTFPAASNLSL